MASQLLGIKTRFTDDLGSPLVGGQVYTYFAGTSTNQDSYSDAALTVPNTNPVILDDTGSADIFLKGSYRIRVFDASGRFIEEQDNVTQAASQGDATELTNKVTSIEGEIVELNKVKFDTGITVTAKNGGTDRTQASKNAETVSIEDFGASTSNADNTTFINNANAYALSVGASVKYPNGEFTVLGDIPNLHNVRAYGTGAIVREGYKFYIEPNNEQQNTLYVKPSGAGDGLSKTSAMGMPQVMGALKNLQGRSKLGKWRVHLCAGTYTNNGVRFTDVPSFNNRLEFTGDLKFTGEHDTIWDGSVSTEAYAMRADLNCAPLRVLAKDIKIIGFDSNPSNAGGLVFWGNHDVITENVWVENCPIGTWTSRNSQHRSRGDTYKNCVTWGIACQYSSSVVVGLSDKRTKFIGCGKGLHVGRASVGHNDYADYEDNDYDIYVTQNSRITHLNPTYKRWKVASHYVQNGAIDESVDVGTYDANSITDATPIIFTENAAVVDAVKGKGLELLHQNYVPNPAKVLTGTTVKTLLSDSDGFGSWLRIPKFLLYQSQSMHIRFNARIQGSNTNGNSEYIIAGPGSSAALELLKFKLPTGGWAGFVDAYFDIRTDGTVYAYGTLTTTSGVLFAQQTTVGSAMSANFRDKTSGLTLWRIYATLATSTDSLTLLSQKTWITL